MRTSFGAWSFKLSVCLSTKVTLTVKAVKASIVSYVSYKKCALLWYAKKEKCLHKISVFFPQKNFPGLPNLGAWVRNTQNRYIAVQMDLQYSIIFVDLKRNGRLSLARNWWCRIHILSQIFWGFLVMLSKFMNIHWIFLGLFNNIKLRFPTSFWKCSLHNA